MSGSVVRLYVAGILALLLSGCVTLSPQQRGAAVQTAHMARSTQVDCTREDACALPSPVLEMARATLAEASAETPQHRALILDQAPDSLLLRVHLIRSAQRSIDQQTYIFDEDDASQLILDELQAAAFRDVKVRILVDQIAALRKIETLAALSAVHTHLELRIYNPVMDRARLTTPMYAVAALCCLRTFNRRMHNKLLLIDDVVGITGGRNYQDDYYDWGSDFNFRDRDILLVGPVTYDMAANFDAFWRSQRSVPAEQLGDVARYLNRHGPPAPPHHPFHKPERVQALLADVDNDAVLRERFVSPALAVQGVHFIADLPAKHRRETEPGAALFSADDASQQLMQLILSAHHEVLMQTPYLVLSKPAQTTFRELHRREAAPRVRISTNSLASTDAFIAYALSYKYKRRYLRDFGFEIHEFKPFPADVPFELGVTGADLTEKENTPVEDRIQMSIPEARLRYGSLRERRLAKRGLQKEPESEAGRRSPFASSGGMPVRLKRAGMRIGLHAKSLVIDNDVGVVGTHNFDPRGDTLNTESAVIIRDPVFAQRLAASILRDMAPSNAWTIARRESAPILSGIEFNLTKLSEKMPIFDLWPRKYATSFEYVVSPECPATEEPPSPFAEGFRRCHRSVGDFPEVDLGLKWLGVRLFTAFGSGLSPIL